MGAFVYRIRFIWQNLKKYSSLSQFWYCYKLLSQSLEL